jgi:hypothetical protein
LANFGALISDLTKLSGNLPRLGRGRIRQRPQDFQAALSQSTQPPTAVSWAVGPGKAPPVSTAQGGVGVADAFRVGIDWFDHVHILPRATIDFGNVITPVEVEYEIFNAFATPVTLTSIVDNVGGGITLPNLTPPATVLEGYSSFLDPSTVRGSQVRLKVRAEADGPPTFDSYLHFVFEPGNEVDLFVKGSRISALTPEPEAPVIEYLEFLTDVIELPDGQEQRISLRKQPRQSFDIRFHSEDDERRSIQSLLFGWQARSFGLPLWHDRLYLTVAASSGVATFTVASTANCELRVDGYAVLFKDSATFDVLKILSLTATTVTFATNSTHAYAVGDMLMPVRTARIKAPIQGIRYPTELETFAARFESLDNDTGTLAGSGAGFSTYNGKALLDQRNFLNDNTMDEDFVQDVKVIDGGSGIAEQFSRWRSHKRGFTIGFTTRSRASLYQLRQLLYLLRGRQVSFWVPTFITDLEVSASLSSGSTQMQVTNCGYTRYVNAIHPKATFKITFTDGTSLVRTIISAIETSSLVETLTLNTTWPSTKTAAQVSRVEFYELVRFESDVFRIEHRYLGHARLEAPVRVVFDS